MSDIYRDEKDAEYIFEEYQNWFSGRRKNAIKRIADIRAEARAEALREAAERAIAHVEDRCYCGMTEIDEARLRSAILADEPRSECVWTEDADGLWATSCDRSWTFIEGGPIENRVRYCHGCGKPVRVAEKREEE